MPALACSVPAAPPPKGMVSNFVNPESDAMYVTIVGFTLLAVSIIIVLLRLYTRAFILRSIGPDDHLIMLALMFCAASTAASQVQTKFGLGKHGWDVLMSDFSPNFLRLMDVSILTYFASMFFIKLSLLFLYRRSLGSDRKIKIAWWSTLVLVVLYNVPCSLILLFSCKPVAALWDMTLAKEAHCFNPTIIIIVQGSFNAFTDLLILGLALMILRTLRLTKQQRLVLTILFVIGSLTAVISAYRITKFIQPVKQNGFMLDDFTYETVAPTVWSLVELNSGIICSSIITLRPLLREYVSSQFPVEIAEADDIKTANKPLTSQKHSHMN